jgi:hypothetical protein
MDVANIIIKIRLRPGNLYLAKMNPANEDVSKMLPVEMVLTSKLFRKNRINGTAVKAST